MRAEAGFNGRARRPRRSIGERVREALMTLAEGQGQVLSHKESPWASITFAGTRHELVFEFTGIAAGKAGERFIAALPDHEFAIPGQLVADATISAVDHACTPELRLVVTVVLLLLEEG